ncbi:MAG: L,D-transpeptidase, partial [Hyphomicrobiales bacterium]
GVGVGRRGFTWYGTAQIKRKSEWPAWHPPQEMIEREKKQYGRTLPSRMEGGPKNPLGARALYLFQGNKDTLYRIHGTNAPWTIGQAVSSGCIRLVNSEIKDLYSRVKIGAKVVVK